MFRRVKPTVAMPLGASMKTAGLSNDTAPESLSLLHDTANAAAVTTTAISFTNPFILPKLYFYVSLKNLCKDTKKRDKSYKGIPNISSVGIWE